MRPTDPLSLAVTGWLTMPVARGTLVLTLRPWYGRWTADATGYSPERSIT